MGVEFAPLESPSMLGCLPKITAFNPSHGFSGQIFVFDLDSVVVGSLDRILSYQGEYCSKAVFHLADKGEWVLAGDLISFHPGMVADAVWSGFVSDPRGVEKLTRGYERFWYRDVFSRLDEEPDMWQKLYPGQFIGYKDHVRGKSLPDNARIVSMYERPKPHEINEQWLLENWR